MPEQKGTHFPNLPPLPDPSKPIKALTDAIKGAQSTSEELADGIVDLRGSGRRLLDFLSKKPWDALPRPKRPAPYDPRGDLRPATVRRETWDFTFKNLKTGEVVKLRESGKSLHEASVQASHRVRTEIEGLGPEEVSTTWALMDAHQPVTTSLAPAVIGPRERLLPQTEEGPTDWTAVYEDTRTGEMAEFNFKAASRQDATAIAPRRFETYIRRGMLTPPMRMWKLRDLHVAGVRFIGGCKVAGAWCQTHDEVAAKERRCPASELTGEEWRMAWEVAKAAFPEGQQPPARERSMLAPAVIGPRQRREAPEGLEYFADSAEQLLASTNPYRAQMDTAFREAIERVRAGR